MTVTYPDTRIDGGIQDTLCGISFPDPYRWLEGYNDEVLQWQKAQAKLATCHVGEWPHVERLRELVAQFSTERPGRTSPLPRYAGGLWFRMRIVPGASQAQAVIADAPMGEGRVLFDPSAEDSERPPFLSWISPSPDG